MSFSRKPDFFKLILDVAQHASFLLAYCDRNLIYRFANNAYKDWFGINPEDIIDKMHIWDIIGTTYEKNLIHINEVLAGTPQTFERKHITPSGVTQITRVSYIPDLNDGSVNGFYINVVDISPLNNGHNENILLAGRPVDLSNQSHYSIEDVSETLKACILTGFPGIASLAKKHFMSESKLKRAFKERYDTTIFSYYRDLQMELAFNYLKEKRFNKNQIAFMLNFANPSNFSACYLKYLKARSSKVSANEKQNEENYLYKIFIEQAPFAICMVNTDLQTLAVSQKWLDEHQLNSVNVSDEFIYDLLTVAPLNNKQLYLDCLRANTVQSNELLAGHGNGTAHSLKWDIRPWYKESKEVGGLIIFTQHTAISKLKKVVN